MMWTVGGERRRRERPMESDWERAERAERLRHAKWLVSHGASLAEVSSETGIAGGTIARSMQREEARSGRS